MQCKVMKQTDRAELIKKLRSDPAPYQEMRAALQIIGDRWSGIILMCLFDKPTRFTEIELLIPDISPRVLSQRLHDLENCGLITKHTYKEFPPRVEYAVTAKAHDLKPALKALKEWAIKHSS